MRRLLLLLMSLVLLMLGAVPASAETTSLDGPAPAFWLSDPDGIDDGTIETGDAITNASGSAKVNNNGATIKVNATGLEPGHAYTMWIVYFNDQTRCEDRGSGVVGCNGEDLAFLDGGVLFGNGGVLFGNGQVVDEDGNATFAARLNTGDTADPPPPPPPFAFAPYEAGEDNEFHVVIRSHGPTIPGEVSEQILTYEGGCFGDDVGPPRPEAPGEFPVPALPTECGDVQLYVFS
jgi:hypothetical protein